MPDAPKQFGPYRVLRELGKGGMGTVYVGVHVETQAQVAIKTLPASDVDERFLREGELLARLNHRNIVRVHAADLQGNPAYLVQDLLPGPDLSERLRSGPLAIAEAVTITIALSRAVAYAHAQGILHRDLKPQNVVFDALGAPVLIDFGLAQATGEAERLTATGEVLGTPNTMAPEQAEGRKQTSTATDVYGLGGLLYAVLTGVAPIASRGSLLATLQAVVSEEPRPPRALRPEIPPAIERECLRALAKSPADRHPSADALAEALEAAAADSGRAARRWPLAAGIGLLTLSVLGGVWVATRPRPNGGVDPTLGHRDQAARLLQDPRVSLQSAEVAALISASHDADDTDACRVLRGLVALSRGDQAAALALKNALTDADALPGCALRGALGALEGDDPASALLDLNKAQRAGVREQDLLGWSVRARRLAGFSSPTDATRALRDLDRIRPTELVPGHAVDRAWALLKLDKVSDASKLAESTRDPAVLMAVILKLLRDGRIEETLPPAACLPPAPTPERKETARAVLETCTQTRLKLGEILPRIQLAHRLHAGVRLSEAATSKVADVLNSTPRTPATLDQGIALALALPYSERITRDVFTPAKQVFSSQQELLLRLIPVAKQLLRLAEGTPRHAATAVEVCGYLNVAKIWPLGAETASRQLKLLDPEVPPILVRRLADALRHSGRHAEAVAAFERLLTLLHEHHPERLRTELDLGVLLIDPPQGNARDPARAVPHLLHFLRKARLSPRTRDQILAPAYHLFQEALRRSPVDFALAREALTRVKSLWSDRALWDLREARLEHLAGNQDAAWTALERARTRLAALGHPPPLRSILRRIQSLDRSELAQLKSILREILQVQYAHPLLLRNHD